jgi:adenylate cyclase
LTYPLGGRSNTGGETQVTTFPEKSRRFFSRQAALAAALVVLTCTAAEVAHRSGALESFEDSYYDLWHNLAGQRREPSHVVIVAIDNQTLLDHRDEPLVFWGPHFARAIHAIRSAGARVIGIDYLFSVSPESWLKKLDLPGSEISRTYDVPIRQQLASGQVVLIGTVAVKEDGGGEILKPVEDYVFSLPGREADVGLANFYSDPDGVVRRFVPALLEEHVHPRLTFATLLALKSARLDPEGASWSFGGHQIPNGTQPCLIGFLGPPGTFRRISFGTVLRAHATGDLARLDLKDKVVIVAAEHVGSQDIHLTPYARGLWGSEGRMMNGAEVHANIVETLLTGRFPRTAPFSARLLCLVPVVCAGTLLFLRFHPFRGLCLGIMLALFCALLGYLLFQMDWIVPVAGPQMALAVSYLGTLGFRLTGEERERARLRQMFGRYVSDEVVEKLLASGRRPDLGGEALRVTVLFSDIRNFTTISERLSAHEVVEMLNAYFGRACEPILSQGGTVDKFIGDAVMAVFGSPVPYPDHAVRGVKAALGMAETAKAFRSWMNSRFPGRQLPEFAVGIGLHTGEAVIGDIGSPKRMEFTAIGDTVNTASRLEGATKQLGCTIVASKATVEEAGPSVLVGRRDRIFLKGKEGPLEVLEVLGYKEGEGGRP